MPFFKNHVFALVVLSVIAISAQAQTEESHAAEHPGVSVAEPAAHHSHTLVSYPSGKQMMAGGIDGAVTPALIPDSTAYRLFMNAVAEPANATSDQIARQRAKLSRASLSEVVLDRVFPIFANYLQQRQNLTQTYQTASVTRTTQTYESQRDAITAAAVAQLKAALSTDGMARLDGLIQGEKRHMTISPFPSMP